MPIEERIPPPPIDIARVHRIVGLVRFYKHASGIEWPAAVREIVWEHQEVPPERRDEYYAAALQIISSHGGRTAAWLPRPIKPATGHRDKLRKWRERFKRNRGLHILNSLGIQRQRHGDPDD